MNNNNNRDYINYATRHLETLNSIIDQMETVNRNMFSLTTRSSPRVSRQTTSSLGAVGDQRTRHRSSLSRYNLDSNIHNESQPQTQTQNYTQNFRRGATMPSGRTSTGLGNSNSTSLSPLLSNVLARWFWDPVSVAPTQEEIDSATTEISFSELPETSLTCPITMETFTEDSEILKINHCGHVFSKPAITRWFRNHVTCPVCRHDIRGEGARTTQQQHNEPGNVQTPGLAQPQPQLQAQPQPQTYQMDFVFDTPEGLNSFFERVGLNSTSIAPSVNDELSLHSPSFYSLPYPPTNNNL